MTPEPIRLTFLRDPGGRPVGKHFQPPAPGQSAYRFTSYQAGREFHWQEETFADIRALSERLTEIENDRARFAILAPVLEEFRGQKIIFRTIKPQADGRPAMLDGEADQSRVVMFDIDNLPVPEGHSWNNPEAMAKAVWRNLGEKSYPLRGVSLCWQASSSAGVPGKEGTAKFHFWAITDRPLDTAERRALYRMVGADEAPATPNQAHYTGAPTFTGFDGPGDPLHGSKRSGLIEGERSEIQADQIQWPAEDVKATREARTGGGERKPLDVASLTRSTTPYGASILRTMCERLAGTTSGRNVEINKVAFTIGGHVAGGSIGAEEAQAALEEAAAATGHPRWGEAVRNGFRDGLAVPIDPPKAAPENLPPFHPAPLADRDAAIAAHGRVVREWGETIIPPIQAMRSVQRAYKRINADFPNKEELDEMPPAEAKAAQSDRKAAQKEARAHAQRVYKLDYLPTTRTPKDMPRTMLTGAQGVGKTAALVGRGDKPGVLHSARGVTTAVLLPTLVKAEEARADYEENADPRTSPPAALVRGRGAETAPGSGRTMCEIPEAANVLAKRGVGVGKALCSVCPHREGCAYLHQTARLAILSNSPDGVVIFADHNYAFLPLPGNVKPDAVVFDEAPRNLGAETTGLSLERLGETLEIDRSKPAGNVADALAANLRTIRPAQVAIRNAASQAPDTMLAHLREGGMTRAKMAEAIEGLTEFEERRAIAATERAIEEHSFASLHGEPDQTLEARIVAAVGAIDTRTTAPLGAIFAAVRDEIDLPRDRSTGVFAGRVKGSRKGVSESGVRVSYLRRPRFDAETPFLHLDGTGDPELMRKLFGPMTIEHHPVERNAHVTQVVGKSFSKTGILATKGDGSAQGGKREEEARRLRDDLNALIDARPGAAVIGSKAVIAALGRDKSPDAAHFGAIRGRNDLERDRVLIIGREEPRALAVEEVARAFASDEPEEFQTGPYEDEPRGLRMADGSSKAIEVRTLPDPWSVRILRQIREAEIEQAIDRARLIHNAEPKRVEILSPVALDITVGRALSWAEFKAGGTRIERAIETARVVPLSARQMRAHFPEIWTRDAAAQADVEALRLTFRFPSNIYLLGKRNDKETGLYAYKVEPKQGGRAREHRAIVFAPPEEARAVLEALTGPLRSFERVEVDPPAGEEQVAEIDRAEDFEILAARFEHLNGLNREEAEIAARRHLDQPPVAEPPEPPPEAMQPPPDAARGQSMPPPAQRRA